MGGAAATGTAVGGGGALLLTKFIRRPKLPKMGGKKALDLKNGKKIKNKS